MISSQVESETICCSYRTEDGQKRQEKGKVCWRRPSKIFFSNLFSDQFWQNGDQRRVGVCWQRRSSLQGETLQLLGHIHHSGFSCFSWTHWSFWCFSDGVHRRRAGLSTSWKAHTSCVCPGVELFQSQGYCWRIFLFQMARQAKLLADRRRGGLRARQVRRGGRAAGRRRP